MTNPVIIRETSETIEIAPGEVVVVLQAGPDGNGYVRHNIKSIEDTGELDPTNGDAAGIVMALTMLEVLESDPAAFQAAMVRVVNRMKGSTLTLVR